MISALCWLRKGAAKQIPDKYEATEAQLKEFHRQILEDSTPSTEEKPEESGQEAADRSAPMDTEDENQQIAKQYNMDSYDDEEHPLASFIDVNDATLLNDDDDSELEDIMIKPSDCLLVTAISDEDFSRVDIHVYEPEDRNLYCHHDIILPVPPLCVEPIAAGRNFLAIGTFAPHIELWDLDVMNSLEPSAILGGYAPPSPPKGKRKSRRRRKQKQHTPPILSHSHQDAVLSLSWNSTVPSLLASGSADNSVKVWNLESQECLQTLQHHQNKVQAVQWHPSESNILLSGTFSGQISVVDVRTPASVRSWKVESDVERVQWHPHSPTKFLASTEEGSVYCFDSLQEGAHVFHVQAHSKAASGLTLSRTVPGLLATCGLDKTLKIWNISNDQPHLLHTIQTKSKDNFCLAFCDDEPNILARAGTGELDIFHLEDMEAISTAFSL